MGTQDMARIAEVVEAEQAGDEARVERVGDAVREFARAFPMPGLG